MNRHTFATIAVYAPVAFLLLAISAPFAGAAELKWLAPVAMKAAATEMAPKFEQASGHKVKIEYATVGAITERLRKGEAADVAIVSGQQIDELLKEGKIAAGSRAEVAKVGFGLLIRKGAKKPNIGTVEAFKSTLLAAKTFSYNDPALGGPSGAYSAKLMDRLGIAAAIKPKLKLLPAGGAVAEAIAKGDIEMGITVASDAVNYPGVEIAGAMPAEVQSYSIYAVGIVAGGKQAAAAKTLTAYLTSPAATAIFKAKGFE